MPMEPVIMDASSERISPNIFSVTIIVELTGVLDQLHGAVVHEHLAVLYVRILGLQLVHHSPPQTAGVQYVGFIHTAELFAALAGCFKADAANAPISCSE